MNAPRAEPHGRFPRRLLDALRAHRLTDTQGGLAMFLCGRADYTTGTYVGTLRMIIDEFNWKHGDDKLRRDLALLKREGWIDFDVRERQRKPWEIRLTGLLVRPSAASTAASTAPSTAAPEGVHLRHPTAVEQQLDDDATAEHEPKRVAFATADRGSDSPSTSTSTSRKALVGREEKNVGKTTGAAVEVESNSAPSHEEIAYEDDLSWTEWTPECLDDDVRACAERGRRLIEIAEGLPPCATCGHPEFFSYNLRCKKCGTQADVSRVESREPE